jgi:Helix-turn-helix domain of resolvase
LLPPTWLVAGCGSPAGSGSDDHPIRVTGRADLAEAIIAIGDSERTLDGLEAARARGRTSGQKPKLGPRQVRLARQMYDEKDEHGKRRHTVQQIADEFGVTRPTIYRHLTRSGP